MTNIYNDLFQFTDVIEPIKLSMHQYLLCSDEAVLIQTGTTSSAAKNLPKIKELVGDKKIKYILISHFESDECGGLSVILNEFPDALTVCSETTARQLYGFGIARNIKIINPNETFTTSNFDFQTIGYPSEMHLWEGLLFFEKTRGIFFGNDLIFQMGETHGLVADSTWENVLSSHCQNALPVKTLQEKLMTDLKTITPTFIATGHSSCFNIIQ
ncbi:MAG: MBL fold metallo-hydrolase [Anaerotignum sp.]